MIIYGKNCILRAFDLKDVKSFYGIAHDDDVKSFVPYAYPENMHEAFENVYAYSCGDMKNDFYLVIERDGEIVGAIISVRTNEDSLDTSAFISKNYRGMGIMTDAMNTFVKWIKENTNYKKLVMTIDLKNVASNHQIKKIGGIFMMEKDSYNVYNVFVR